MRTHYIKHGSIKEFWRGKWNTVCGEMKSLGVIVTARKSVSSDWRLQAAIIEDNKAVRPGRGFLS